MTAKKLATAAKKIAPAISVDALAAIAIFFCALETADNSA